jgi:hypothetical protein
MVGDDGFAGLPVDLSREVLPADQADVQARR